MPSRDDVIAQIRQAFDQAPSPGPAFLVGSREGTEPDEAVAPFRTFTHWSEADAALLDRQYNALSFFSEGGFRFFLPAYLVADLRGELKTADPVFHLTHGFHETAIQQTVGGRTFTWRTGRDELLNPQRYGAITWRDHARFRLSVFTREEASAIVAYLEARREADTDGVDRPAIDAALEAFWRARAISAPDSRALAQHLRDEAQWIEALDQHRRKGED